VVFFKKKISELNRKLTKIIKAMTALGEIDINVQKTRSGSTQGGGVYAPPSTLPTTSAGVNPNADQKARTGAGPVTSSPPPEEKEEEGRDLMLIEQIKKYAPYAIAAVALYYFIIKK
jgi:hypothetical protein